MRFTLILLLLTSSFLLKGQAVKDSTGLQSIFDYMYHLEERATVIIDTDTKLLLRNKHKKQYQPASVLLAMGNQDTLDFAASIRVRGMTRKKVCRIPPVKLNFEKAELNQKGFGNLDKLKFVFPCTESFSSQEKMYKEHFLYELYNQIDTNGLRTFLVDVKVLNGGETKYNFTALVVEDEEHYTVRKNAQIVESGKLRASGLDRNSFVNMILFQYMIANTDWAVRNRHNLEMMKLESLSRVIAIPYDFDYSGFVGQTYAVPHGSLPIKSVQERYFFNYQMSDKEFYRGLNLFKISRDQLLEFCLSPAYLTEGSKKQNRDFLSSFFRLLERPEALRALTKS